MNTLQLLLTSLLFIFTSPLFAQDQILQQSELAEAEFHTAINPMDSNNIVVATMRGFENTSDSYFSIYYTKDFGESWELSDFQGKYPDHVGTGDPVLSFNSEGALTLVHLVVTDADEILTVLSESLDFGETWELKYQFPPNFTDKPWIAIDKSESSPYKGNIYSPTVVDEVELICLRPDYSLITAEKVPGGDHIPSVVTNNDGDVFVSNMKWDDPIEMYVQQYTDEGTTLVHSTYVTTFPDYTFNAFDISTRFQPSPYLAIDNSNGEYSGRLYMSYTGSEAVEEDYFNVFLTYSDDNGLSWSEPSIVHSDISNSIHQFYSSIYVNDQGTLLIDWYDRSNYDNTNGNTDFLLGISYDGGESFVQTQLNSEPMDFEIASVAGFGFGIGEYHQVVATDNTAISFWSDGRTNDGDLNIYYAKVNIENPLSSVQEQSLINDKVSISNIYPQPVFDQINLSITVDKATSLKFEIVSIDGKVVVEREWEKYSSGDHDIKIPLELESGQYILRSTTKKGYFKNQMFVVVK